MGPENYIYLFVEFVACIFAVIYWKNYKHTPLWIFLPFLLYTLVNEFLATHIALEYRTRIAYNIYIIISFFVYLYWFDKLLKFKFWKWIFLAIFIAAALYDIQTRGFFKPLLKTSVNVQSIMVLGFSLMYFAKLLRKDEVVHYQRLPEFWIVCGMLMFYIGYIPLSFIIGQGYKVQHLYSVAIIILNVLLYGGYIIGFYVSRKR